MYKRRVFTHTWKPMDDLAFIDLTSLDRLLDPATCPRCGMVSAEWTADEGDGFALEGDTFCCRGCAEGRGCTCREPSSSREAWEGVGGFLAEDDQDEDIEIDDEPDGTEEAEEPLEGPKPLARNAFTVTWRAQRAGASEPPQAGELDGDAKDAKADDQPAEETEKAEESGRRRPGTSAPSGAPRRSGRSKRRTSPSRASDPAARRAGSRQRSRTSPARRGSQSPRRRSRRC